MKRIAAAFCFSSLALAGCGFTPMYSTQDGLETGPIQIGKIDGYAGHAMRKELLMLLRPGLPGVSSGTLEVTAEENIRNFDFQPQGTTSRTRVSLSAKYQLVTPDGILQGNVTGSANIVGTSLPYQDVTARREAFSKAGLDAATKLAEELRLKSGNPDAYRQPRSKADG